MFRDSVVRMKYLPWLSSSAMFSITDRVFKQNVSLMINLTLTVFFSEAHFGTRFSVI